MCCFVVIWASLGPLLWLLPFLWQYRKITKKMSKNNLCLIKTPSSRGRSRAHCERLQSINLINTPNSINTKKNQRSCSWKKASEQCTKSSDDIARHMAVKAYVSLQVYSWMSDYEAGQVQSPFIVRFGTFACVCSMATQFLTEQNNQHGPSGACCAA